MSCSGNRSRCNPKRKVGHRSEAGRRRRTSTMRSFSTPRTDYATFTRPLVWQGFLPDHTQQTLIVPDWDVISAMCALLIVKALIVMLEMILFIIVRLAYVG